MAKGGKYITIDTSDLKDVIKSFDNLTELAKKYISIDVKTASILAVAEAKLLVPKNIGTLRNSISNKKVDDLTYSIGTNEVYGPFVEFGTGGKVDAPPGFEKFASQFKGGGSGDFEDGLESIRQWCRDKGIDEKFAYPIFVSILNKGIEPQPFLIPAGKYGASQLLSLITKTFTELSKSNQLYK